ncbi:MAG: hypothetical protein KDA58_16650, partial [Planctomycetaceae bacterium]|nr:hypothetical protein [Planctomycetaceae bacterium]
LVNPPLTGDLMHYEPTSLTDEDAPLSSRPVDTSGYPNVNAHQHWIDCIRAGVQPQITNARTARHVTEIMLKGLESAREGRTVAIESRL